MATQSLVRQSVVFISSTGQYDESAIYANSLIQSLASNSAGGAITGDYKAYQAWNATTHVWTPNSYYEITCYVPPAFQTTIQQNIGALQAAFPQYTIVTYGSPVTFGS